jgi:CRP/FNR family transcriptional regulator, cyclic AMP receptor protein
VKREDALSGLAACPLFQDLGPDPAATDHLAEICEVQTARPGQVLIEEGSEGDWLYVIVKGRVRTEKHTPYGDLYTVRFLQEGNFFGEMSLLDRDIRSATVTAETECEFLVIGRDRFLAFGNRYPVAGLQVTRRVAERVSRRLRRANEDVISLFAALVHEIEQRL